mgnify:CR=1 FL=1
MGNFSESTLLASGMSAVDFFANKGNQESVLEEISVFGDAVLYGWIRVPLGLTSVALNVLYGLLVLQFNKMLKNAGMAR